MIRIKDAVEIAVMKVFTVENVSYMCILGRNQSCPRNTPIARPTENMLVSCNDQEASFTIGFVGHRVACENVVGSVCENVTAFHRHWIDEPHLRGFQIHSVALKVGFRDEECRLLEGCQQGFYSSEHGFNYRF